MKGCPRAATESINKRPCILGLWFEGLVQGPRGQSEDLGTTGRKWQRPEMYLAILSCRLKV